MVEGPHAQPGVGRVIADDDIELVQRQLCQQPVGVAVDAGDQHVFSRQPHPGHQQSMDNQLAQGVGDTDYQPEATPCAPASDGIGQLSAQRKDLVGIAIDRAASVGEHQRPAPAFKELGLERLLELLQLAANCRLGEVQPAAGCSNAALAGDGPEIEQVVVIQPVHRFGNP